MVQYGYNEYGQKTVMTYPDGTQARYAYDEMSRLVSVTAPDGTATRYEYDLLGRRTRTTDGTLTTAYRYDRNGNLIEQRNKETTIPCLTSSFKNQGLNYYSPKQGATILKDVITIPQNSDVYRAYYQSSEFTVLSDAYAIEWRYDDRKLTREQYLFMVMCINKVTDLPIYSHKNKLGGWNVVKKKSISLPQTNGEIDFEYMNQYISALEKQEIKGVVDYINNSITEHKASSN